MQQIILQKIPISISKNYNLNKTFFNLIYVLFYKHLFKQLLQHRIQKQYLLILHLLSQNLQQLLFSQ